MEAVETFEFDHGIIGKVFQEEYAEDFANPREWCQLGTMVCEHPRYVLGDQRPEPGAPVSLVLYVEYPWNQTSGQPADARLHELDSPDDDGRVFMDWIEGRYPAMEFVWGGSEAIEAEVFGNYLEGEDTTSLVGRLTGVRDYRRLHDEGTVLYTMRDAWAEHVGVDLYTNDNEKEER